MYYTPVVLPFDVFLFCADQNLLQMNAIRRLMDNLRDQHRDEAPKHEALNIMLLANLTRSDEGIHQFFGSAKDGVGGHVNVSTLSDLFLRRLVKDFMAAPKASADG